ncbi:3-dehydroquinate synthase [Clostridium sp. D2Q-11]|uniref:3-dehydroquinate synthase n=1 Tax=Anaeromonas frigoriresistens TaxID=2683708 RepID=A0A942UYT5_9FIRM|nr:3-dehydroquinate synthase [Anaeromonas frigoriresistens]MBS4540115.1 3-dehydroquinate synthase [Anaeromonas frigoriresistens]
MDLNIRTLRENYPVYIEKNLLKELPAYLKEYKKEKILIITDENVARLYLGSVLKRLNDFPVYSYIVPIGEESKSIDMSKNIYNKLLKEKFNRKSLIISLGGGVIGDLSGFVASTYMRGIDFIQIPTTILSQVDSSVGGKVAVNFNNIKNIIGSFYQPKKVLIDIDTLSTLKDRDIDSGLAEVIKYGIIKDYKFFQWLSKEIDNIKNLEYEKIKKIIKRSLEIKEEIVYLDTYEKSIRKILNFGHTIGHGIESLYGFSKFKHGEAVALGMISEAYIAKEIGYISKEYYEEIKKLILRIIDLEKFSEKEKEDILNSIENDKKNVNDNIVIILPTNHGEVNIFDKVINRDLIIKSLGEDR